MVTSIGHWSKLSQAWRKEFVQDLPAGDNDARKVVSALERSLPLLQDPTAVPFVCRYRADVIDPLSTKQIHQLSDMIQKHSSLAALRNRILPLIPENDSELKFRVETSVSKLELEDIYNRFKPPSKGSLEYRIKKENPALIAAVDAFWFENSGDAKSLFPRADAIILLANRISTHLPMLDDAIAFTNSKCRVKVSKASSASKLDQSLVDKYKDYFDFERSFGSLRDHQVLAIRRGCDQKVLAQTFDVDITRAVSMIRRSLTKNEILGDTNYSLFRDAIKDAWIRLIRRRCTSRLWKKHCDLAQDRAIQVFCDNLRKALLAPPRPGPLLALDPGFRAGIKCALLDATGQLSSTDSLRTVKFLGNSYESGKKDMMELLQACQPLTSGRICVALGNGHGTNEARKLVKDAATCAGLDIDVNLVSEAGASVWSVTECASKEFPSETPAAVAAVSIGRRYLNPMAELVKIPPRSLGLGMYQHDISEKKLDRKLTITSVDAVAEVGVDVNACSVEILEKVPGLTRSMAEKVMEVRPLRQRTDLLKIAGLGPKKFENCAAFIRVEGEKDLDATLVHPESYDLAQWLLKKLKWDLKDPSSLGIIPSKEHRRVEWEAVATKASDRFNVGIDRVFNVLDHLLFSIINPDPRLREEEGDASSEIGELSRCSALPAHLMSLTELQKVLPVRNVIATIRNVVDFGVFVDFGGENDGLLHRSKLGSVPIGSLLVGNEIGIDILGVSMSNKISVSLAGSNLPVEDIDSRGTKRTTAKAPKRDPPAKRQRTG